MGSWAGEAQEAQQQSPKQQQQEGDEEEGVEVELLVSKNGGLHLKASALDEEEVKVLEAEARVARLVAFSRPSPLCARASRAGESSGERNGWLVETCQNSE